MKYLAVLALLLLASCATPEQVNARDDATCRSYGLDYGTPQYAQCRMLIDQQRSANAAAANAQFLGAGLIPNQQSQPYTLQQPGFACWNMGQMTRCQ